MYVDIVPETPTCKRQDSGGVEWPKTGEGNSARRPCPGNATGDQIDGLNYEKSNHHFSTFPKELQGFSETFLKQIFRML